MLGLSPVTRNNHLDRYKILLGCAPFIPIKVYPVDSLPLHLPQGISFRIRSVTFLIKTQPIRDTSIWRPTTRGVTKEQFTKNLYIC